MIVLPRIIIHNGVSVDGRMDWDWFNLDLGLYYELAGRFGAQAILSGSNTMAKALSEAIPENQPAEAMAPDSAEAANVSEGAPDEDTQPGEDAYRWMVVVDSKGRLRNLHHIRQTPYWHDTIVLCAESTPADYLAYLDEHGFTTIVSGREQVDLRAALARLAEQFQVKVIRVDSGGVLNGVLLRAGLVDEISLLVTPTLVGGNSPRSIFVAPDLTSAEDIIDLRLIHLEALRDGHVWLRYEVIRKGGER